MQKKTLSAEERRRYSRNIMLDGIGKDGQQRMSDASVLIVGTGALGSVASMYLAASGIGRIGIVDFDNIEISNLQRQLSFTETDIGMSKVEVTKNKLNGINSLISVEPYNLFLKPSDARKLIGNYDIIVEGSDNPDTKYMINDICVELSKPYVLGGVSKYSGQVMTWRPGHTNYRDIFPEAETAGFIPCSIGGVLGPLPGIIGSIQATEVIKLITGAGDTLTDRFLTVDALTMKFSILELKDSF